jgi:chorismate lyase/3-hydroxybenzoate synthase
MVIAFLAGKAHSRPIENPRQVSAYRYPEQYGPRGPTFARAAYVVWGGCEQLYISGTASIVGHESRHPGDAPAQLDETLRNLQSLQRAAEDVAGTRTWEQRLFKVYVRPGTSLHDTERRLRQTFGEDADVMVVEAEICRRELLVEIEGLALRAQR